MHVNLDGQEYHINLKKVFEDLKTIYDNHVIKGIPFPNGYIIQFDKKSLPVLGLKQAIAMLVIPALTELYKLKGYEIEKKKKHEDVIDYFVKNVLVFASLVENNHRFIMTTEEDENSIRELKTIVNDKKIVKIEQESCQ